MTFTHLLQCVLLGSWLHASNILCGKVFLVFCLDLVGEHACNPASYAYLKHFLDEHLMYLLLSLVDIIEYRFSQSSECLSSALIMLV